MFFEHRVFVCEEQMIKEGTRVKLTLDGSVVAGTVVDIAENNVALVEIMRVGNWHYHCPVDQLIKISSNEEKQFYLENK